MDNILCGAGEFVNIGFMMVLESSSGSGTSDIAIVTSMFWADLPVVRLCLLHVIFWLYFIVIVVLWIMITAKDNHS